MLVGRRNECRQLDELIRNVRQGTSHSLVIRGDPGIGKSALLEYLTEQVPDFRVVRAAGVQAEAELAFAGLHQLCQPLLDSLDRIPSSHRDALSTAFGLRAGAPPDAFFIGLAVLSLLAEAAAERPLLCVIDDGQWLDRTSAETMSFVARRLGNESIALVFSLRNVADNEHLAGPAQLVVGGLHAEDARELLATAIPGPLDERVRDRIVAETRGNPLALLELSQGLSYAGLAGGFGLPEAQEISDRIEDSFQRRLAALPAHARRLLLVAAVDSTGDPSLIRRAALRLGVEVDQPDPAAFAGLLRWDTTITFRHPLARSAVYRAAATKERRETHRALAEVTDPATDADGRVWHLAHAADGPDDHVAGELERSADRARSRGGLAAAAAFLERAALFTADPAPRARRALAAAGTKFQAGDFDATRELLKMAAVGPLSELDQARVDLIQGRLARVSNRAGDASVLLVHAAERLAPVDPDLSRATYLDALSAAMFAGPLASPGGGPLEVARAAGAAPPRLLDTPRTPDLLLAGLAANFNDGYEAAVPILRQALAAFGHGMSPDEELRWLWLTTLAAVHLWDDERWDALSDRYVQLARNTGALTELPVALSTRAIMLLFAGDLTTATSLVDEQRTVTEATGRNLTPYSAMAVAALSGRQDEASALIEATAEEVARRGEGIGIAVAHWTNALLHNGLGNYPEAMAAAQQALRDQQYPNVRYPGGETWAAAELIEAAALSGAKETAAEAFDWIASMTSASRTGWAIAFEARSRALVSSPDLAEPHFREAIERLSSTRLRTELARTRLLYGEWLRRRNRRVDAREQLRAAHEMLAAMGAEAFAERARRELVATGEKARKRTVTTRVQLTGREGQVARMASDGLSNPEIGTRLLVSPRTVEYHLRNVFIKLGITSRHELDPALAGTSSSGSG